MLLLNRGTWLGALHSGVMLIGLILVGRTMADPGSGSVGFQGAGGVSCSSCAGAGSQEFPLGVRYRINMGVGLSGKPSGDFYVEEASPSASLSKPDSLRYTLSGGGSSGVEVIRNAQGILLQVVAPQAFADIVTLSVSAFEIRVYRLAAKGTQSGPGGPYAVLNPAANIITTWKIENPNPPPGGDLNSLTITETPAGGSARVWTYGFDSLLNTWTLTFPGGLGSQKISRLTAGTDQVSSLTVLSALGDVLYFASKTYRNIQLAADQAALPALVEERVGVAGPDQQLTSYEYYTSFPTAEVPFTPVAGQFLPKSVVRPGGSWMRFPAYDSKGRALSVISAFQDAPLSSAANLAKETLYTYVPKVGDALYSDALFVKLRSMGDDPSVASDSPRKIEERVLGQTVTVTYFVYGASESRKIRCSAVSNDPDNPGNLVSWNRRQVGGVNDGYPKSSKNEDGTMRFLSYSDNGTQFTSVESQGEPNGPTETATGILNGKQTTLVQGSSLREPISRTVRVISGGVVGAMISNEVFSDYDSYLRPQQVVFLDGQTNRSVYGCCGLDSSKSKDEVVTTYGYDALKRQISSTTLGIASVDVLDAVGWVRVRKRFGTDASERILGQTAYDTAGRVIRETNALQGVTQISYSSPSQLALTKTTTNPDLGQVVESYYLDGTLKSVTTSLSDPATSPVRYESGVASNGGANRRFKKTIKLSATGAETEFTIVFQDELDRTYTTVYPGAVPPSEITTYNAQNRIQSQKDPDGVARLLQYDGEGNVVISCLDSNRNGAIDLGAPSTAGTAQDRIQKTTIGYGTKVDGSLSFNTRIQTTSSYTTENSDAVFAQRVDESSFDGLRSWSTVYKEGGLSITTVNRVRWAGGGNRYVTNTAPDGSYTLTRYTSGRQVSITRKSASHAQIGSVTYSYDSHGRLKSLNDARNGITTYTYNAADQIESVTTPAPAGGAKQTSWTFYDSSQRAIRRVLSDGTEVYNEYFKNGLLKKTYGSRTYPVEYAYDVQGRLVTMKTWQSFSANTGSAITQWQYDPDRGRLQSKFYADATTGTPSGTGVQYSYSAAGRLQSRTWLRGSPRITATYVYNDAGDLASISYNDGTPTVTYGFDRRGRRNRVDRNGITTTLAYNEANQSVSETYTGGTLNGLSLSAGYDSLFRRNQINPKKLGVALVTHTLTFDNAGRALTLSDGVNSATYGYEPNSALVSTTTFKQSTTTRMVTSKTYDALNRMMESSSTAGGAVVLGHAYGYNDANQRVRRTEADGSYWVYEYDRLGQVIAGRKYWADATPVAGQQFEYTFDDIGNRKVSRNGGDQAGDNLRETSYTANRLNQYSSRTTPASADVIGMARGNAVTVKLNGTSVGAPYRKGEYFWKNVTVRPGTSPATGTIAFDVDGTAFSGGTVTLPAQVEQTAAPANLAYDADGNLTLDSLWSYQWDAENRLVAMLRVDGSKRVEMEYDHVGRRIGKKVYSASTGGTLILQEKYLYDGWNLVAVLDGANVLQKSFLWGTDLSGSMQGAGGVGGLIAFTKHAAPSTGTWFAAFDGNGNLGAMVSATDGSVQATYEYGPFGEVIRATGANAKANPFRFSTKFQDDETDLVYYGYRFYNASTGRWLSRDPIEEKGGKNLYSFTINSPLGHFDRDGRDIDFGYNPYGWPDESFTPDADLFLQWVFGGGGQFIRRGGNWASFVANNPNVSRLLRERQRLIAIKALRDCEAGRKYGGTYFFGDPTAQISETSIQTMTLNWGTIYQYGKCYALF